VSRRQTIAGVYDSPAPLLERFAHLEVTMLEVFCYTIGFILLALAAVLPGAIPRDRMAYAGLALWLLPTTVHALQAH
jgi:hypothetical protein